MDYAEAQAAFFGTRAGDAPPPGSRRWSSPARRLRDAIEPIATICFWSEPAYDAYAAEGLDFLEGYVWGRGSALGEADGAVAAAAFGVFEPGLIATTFDAARAKVDLPTIRAAKRDGTIAALDATIGEDPDIVRVTAALRQGLGAARSDGRALFAGLAGTGWPSQPLAALWHACSLLREYRGDGHLIALLAAGLDGLEAGMLTEASIGWERHVYTASRGWSPGEMEAAWERLVEGGWLDEGGVTAAGSRLRDRIETTTDELVAEVIAAMGSDLDAVVEACDGWSHTIVQAGWFPPDPYKRASG